jgi:acyl-CoA thioester hydrolase
MTDGAMTDGAITGQPLRTDRFRVTMGDTDAAQIIYFGAPVRWAERLFTGYLADIGLPTSAVLASGRGFPAVELNVTYRRPLRLDDEVRGELRVNRRSARSVTWQCDFFAASQGAGSQALAVRVLTTQVSVQLADGQPSSVTLPPELVSRLDSSPEEPGMTEWEEPR